MKQAPFAVVLGIAQDGGRPQAGCRAACCARAWADPAARELVACLGVVDPAAGRRWLVDATPDLPAQLHALNELLPGSASAAPDGILLTHAHTGHYTGLVHLGREALAARGVPVHVLPRLRAFLAGSGPWEQLVRLGNVSLEPLEPERPFPLSPNLSATPLLVPHRGEYSETAAFLLAGPRASGLFLPDIDSWEAWPTPLEEVLRGVEWALLDGTFFTEGELPGRDATEVCHPTIASSLARLSALPARERAKVRFVHLNHTNPALDPASDARRRIEAAGLAVAREGERLPL